MIKKKEDSTGNRYKVEIEEKFIFCKSTRWNNGNIRNIVSINLSQHLSKGNFDNLGNLDLTAFFKLRTIQNNSNSGNNRNIDLRLDSSQMRSTWNSGNSGNLRNFALADFFKLRTIRNSSNNGNIGNIDPRLDFSKIRSARIVVILVI